jgi:hypothetical protein
MSWNFENADMSHNHLSGEELKSVVLNSYNRVYSDVATVLKDLICFEKKENCIVC